MIGAISRKTEKGFGFITPESGEKDVFFHSNELSGLTFDEFFVGQRVQFRVVEGAKGMTAEAVELLESISGKTHEVAASVDAAVIVIIRECNAELMRYLQKHPEELDQIHPEAFEDIVAEIFQSEGFETERISSWNQADGGVDLIAIRKLYGEYDLRCAIQCKRFRRDKRVSAAPIRELAGVLDRFHAHAGVVATNVYFTQPAKDEVKRHLWRISLHDYDAIVASLRKLTLLQK